jgi:phosphoribosylformylglycinamidine synthase
MAEACKQLDFPVVSGNVSLYNETDGVGIPPTPVVGGIGLIDDLDRIATLKGAQDGDALVLIGETRGHLGASAYARTILGLDGAAAGPAPPIDLNIEKRNAAFVRKLVHEGLVHAVHDVSEGGIACAMAEMALSSGLGAFADLYGHCVGAPRGFGPGASVQGILFGEDSARYVIAAPRGSTARIQSLAKEAGVPCDCLGASDGFSKSEQSVGFSFDEFGIHGAPLSALRAAYEGWLPAYMKG